ncbi:hypothetical protein J4474_01740 [Candidatus Pacearchaeota archaeon]|nr:hypothetical protein [Candidatus Pacearchaeota archaeon]
MVRKEFILSLSMIFLVFASLGFASAWVFNGTVYDVDGNALNNTLVNITLYTMGAQGPALLGSNSTTSNSSGWFNVSVSENISYMYKPIIQHFNSSNNDLDFIGQSLPAFPYAEFVNMSDMNFYLRSAGTINITAINSTGDRISFNYMVKDTALGYDIASNWQSTVSEAVIYVPRERNYSIMVYPQQSLPVSFNWNNFSSTNSYTFGQSLSTYNSTTHILKKRFNCTESMVRVTGYLQNTSGDDFTDYNEFTLVPYLLEPGNMIFFDQGNLPWNMSAWTGQTDEYNLTTGWYNVSLPAPAESTSYILFATARNGSSYFGGYKNVSLNYGASPIQHNLTAYSLMGSNWGLSNGNISMHSASGWNQLNISSARQGFNLLNSSGDLITNINAHLEIKVDYSNYGAVEFTFMKDISSSIGTFFLPLINNTGVKKMSIYSQSFSPKSIPSMSVSGIFSNPNITMTSFNPGDIDGALTTSQISVTIYKSNSTCDVPNPPSVCILTASAAMDSFNPLSAIIAGGKISFRMGSGNLFVHYVNVDMLASGPPDALFENDAGASDSSATFSNAVKFGSGGPTIYDYVLVSMPYSESSGSGLNDSDTVSMVIPTFYGEDSNGNLNWTSPIWVGSTNGTNVSAFAGNYSHYSVRQSEWQYLMSSSVCASTSTGTSPLTSTSPCAIDTSNNRVWIRLPHFSGTAPSISGSILSSDSGSTTSPSGGGSSPSTTSVWANTYVLDSVDFSSMLTLTKDLGIKNRIKLKIGGETHYVGVLSVSESSALVEVSSSPINSTLQIGEEKKFDVDVNGVYDLIVKLNSIEGNKANLTINYIQESIPENKRMTDNNALEQDYSPKSSIKSKSILFILLVIAVAVVLGITFLGRKKK